MCLLPINLNWRLKRINAIAYCDRASLSQLTRQTVVGDGRRSMVDGDWQATGVLWTLGATVSAAVVILSQNNFLKSRPPKKIYFYL